MDNRQGGFGSKQGSSDRRGSYGSNQGSRDNRRGGEGFGGDRSPREMHKVVCADCGNECTVPFKPSNDRPVYCRDCYGKHKKF